MSEELTNWQPPVLETERLLLRPVTLEDAPAIFSWSSKPQISEYAGWNTYQSMDEAYQYINIHVFQNYKNRVPEPWAITKKENPSLMIGSIGYTIDDLHWGQGLAAEAAKAVIDSCFKLYPLKRIQARCVEESSQSKRVMEKSGMQYEGLQKQVSFAKGRYWNMHVYAVTKD
jgi:ribosomal-protein-alanine N-acetyltransferase